MQIPKGTKPPRNKPKRLQDRAHLEFVASLACCCCGKMPVQVHHLIGRYVGGPIREGIKAGDSFTIALCFRHHDLLHNNGNEIEFLNGYGVDGLAQAAKNWSESHG